MIVTQHVSAILSLNGPNGLETIEFDSIDKAVSFIFSNVVYLNKTADKYDSWIEEKDGKLWCHWLDQSYGEYDTLFDLKTVSDAPKTIEELFSWVRQGKEFYLGWADRGCTRVQITYHIQQLTFRNDSRSSLIISN